MGEVWARAWRTLATAAVLAALWPLALWVVAWMFWWWWYLVPLALLGGAGLIALHDRMVRRRHARALVRREAIRRRLWWAGVDEVLRDGYLRDLRRSAFGEPG